MKHFTVFVLLVCLLDFVLSFLRPLSVCLSICLSTSVSCFLLFFRKFGIELVVGKFSQLNLSLFFFEALRKLHTPICHEHVLCLWRISEALLTGHYILHCTHRFHCQLVPCCRLADTIVLLKFLPSQLNFSVILGYRLHLSNCLCISVSVCFPLSLSVCPPSSSLSLALSVLVWNFLCSIYKSSCIKFY